MRLRAWQQEALSKFRAAGEPQDFLVTATPGAGKTTFALSFAKQFLSTRRVDRIIVVVPTDHLRSQWALAAANHDIALDPSLSNDVGQVAPDFHGYIATYAQVALRPALHRARTDAKRTLVILDEVHHAGDGLTWGDGVREAFEPAVQRLSLTGTPFRSKSDETIPFVRYSPTDDGLESSADYTYGYTEALADKVVRPVMFAAYTGTTRYMNSAGDVISASLTEPMTKSAELQAWRTALDPTGAWVPHVIRAMWERLNQVRQTVPDASGLILASDQDAARAYAKIAETITGEPVALITSDDPQASLKIAEFGAGSHKIAVCVRMISEGVDIPSASVLAWLTSYRTPLFFAQAVGRVVRARSPHEVATVFLPAVRPLLTLAAEMETRRNHVIRTRTEAVDDLDALLHPDDAAADAAGGSEYQALGADAEFAHILYEGRAVTADLSAEEEEFLGIPGLLTPEQTASLLKTREATIKAEIATTVGQAGGADHGLDVAQRIRDTRREINKLVSYYAMRKNLTHAHVHSLLRREVPGPPSNAASLAVLEQRRDHIKTLANRP